MINTNQQVAVITGVSNGLGLATAKHFISADIIVVGLSRTKPPIELTRWIQTDITVAEQRNRAVEQIVNEFGKIDLLINNAGIGCYSTWEEMNKNEIQQLFALNFFSAIELTRCCLSWLKESNGTIINVSSVAGKLYVPCMGAYCASKAAMTAYSNTLRVELRQYNIHVMDVTPGRIDTGFSGRALGNRRPPRSPGGGAPEKFAQKLLHAWRNKKRNLTYPAWNLLAVPLVLTIARFYDNKSLKIWGLTKNG